MHMNDLVSCGIEYKITQDKGTHAIAPGFVYCCGLGSPFFLRPCLLGQSSCMHMHWAEKPNLERHVTLPLFILPNAALEMRNQALPIWTSDGILFFLFLARLS